MSLLKDVIGYGTHAERPASGSEGRLYYETDTNTLLRDSGTVWVALVFAVPPPALGDVVQLDYALAVDTTVSLVNDTWTDFIADQSFAINFDTSLVEIAVSGFVTVGGGGYDNLGARLVIDSGGTPIIKMLSGNYVLATNYANVLAGAGSVTLTGLAIGSHTVKLQVYQSAGSTAYCRPVTVEPDTESLQIRVIERKW